MPTATDYEKNKEAYKLRAKKWKEMNPHRAFFLAKRSHARQDGVEFTLDMDDLDWPTHCPVFGTLLLYNQGGRGNPNGASVDRIDNSRGYVAGNVAIISRRANTMKHNAGVEDIKALLKWLESVTPNQ